MIYICSYSCSSLLSVGSLSYFPAEGLYEDGSTGAFISLRFKKTQDSGYEIQEYMTESNGTHTYLLEQVKYDSHYLEIGIQAPKYTFGLQNSTHDSLMYLTANESILIQIDSNFHVLEVKHGTSLYYANYTVTIEGIGMVQNIYKIKKIYFYDGFHIYCFEGKKNIPILIAGYLYYNKEEAIYSIDSTFNQDKGPIMCAYALKLTANTSKPIPVPIKNLPYISQATKKYLDTQTKQSATQNQHNQVLYAKDNLIRYSKRSTNRGAHEDIRVHQNPHERWIFPSALKQELEIVFGSAMKETNPIILSDLASPLHGSRVKPADTYSIYFIEPEVRRQITDWVISEWSLVRKHLYQHILPKKFFVTSITANIRFCISIFFFFFLLFL